MSLDVFINFDGNCRAALDFYAQVFGVEPQGVMRYGDNPGGSAPEDAERILYASLPIFGSNVMLSDCPTGSRAYLQGTNIQLTLGSPDTAELARLYEELKAGGTVIMALGPQFFSDLFAMVVDRFGIGWQLSQSAA